MTIVPKFFLGATLLSLLVASAGTPLAARAASPAGNPKDRGQFIFKLGGQQIGTETFEIAPKGDRVEATAKIELRVHQDEKRVELRSFPRLVMTPDLEPLNYEWSLKGPQSSQLAVTFQSPRARAKYRTVSGQEDLREFELPKNLVILDNNVIHHYQIIVLRYGLAGGGKQTFRAFIPQEALPGSLTIEDAGPERVDVGGREQLLEHLVVTTDNARIELWVDGKNRLQKVSIPAGQLEVYRKK